MDLEERVGTCQAQKQGEEGFFWQTLGKTGVLRACPGTDVRPGGARKAVSACR